MLNEYKESRRQSRHLCQINLILGRKKIPNTYSLVTSRGRPFLMVGMVIRFLEEQSTSTVAMPLIQDEWHLHCLGHLDQRASETPQNMTVTMIRLMIHFLVQKFPLGLVIVADLLDFIYFHQKSRTLQKS